MVDGPRVKLRARGAVVALEEERGEARGERRQGAEGDRAPSGRGFGGASPRRVRASPGSRRRGWLSGTGGKDLRLRPCRRVEGRVRQLAPGSSGPCATRGRFHSRGSSSFSSSLASPSYRHRPRLWAAADAHRPQRVDRVASGEELLVSRRSPLGPAYGAQLRRTIGALAALAQLGHIEGLRQ